MRFMGYRDRGCRVGEASEAWRPQKGQYRSPGEMKQLGEGTHGERAPCAGGPCPITFAQRFGRDGRMKTGRRSSVWESGSIESKLWSWEDRQGGAGKGQSRELPGQWARLPSSPLFGKIIAAHAATCLHQYLGLHL